MKLKTQQENVKSALNQKGIVVTVCIYISIIHNNINYIIPCSKLYICTRYFCENCSTVHLQVKKSKTHTMKVFIIKSPSGNLTKSGYVLCTHGMTLQN